MKRICILIPLVLCAWGTLRADDPFAQPSFQAMGGAYRATPASFMLNPAAAGWEDRYGLFGAYGSGDSVTAYRGVFALPTRVGVFAAGADRLETDAGDSSFDAAFGFAKEVYPFLSAGFSLLYGSQNVDDASGGYAGGSFGLSAVYPVYRRLFSEIGFFEPDVSMAFRSGFSWGDAPAQARISAAAGFGFIRMANYTAALRVRADREFEQETLPWGLGLENVILDRFCAKAGLLFTDGAYEGFTFGGGLMLPFAMSDLRLDYSFTRRDETVHLLALGVRLGTSDKDPPEVRVQVSPAWISPNYDGRNDYTVFDFRVDDRDAIEGWLFQITDSSGAIFKEYRSSDRTIDPGFSLGGFFRRFFSAKASISVPSRILWDGHSPSGTIGADGEYRYAFMAWDKSGNYSQKVSGAVVVDTTNPFAELTAADLIFSPNGDRNKDELVIRQRAVSAAGDEWQGTITDAAGAVVRSWRWTDVPALLKWDGRDDAGADLPEGLYAYALNCTDRAGNVAAADVRNITLRRGIETVDASLPVRFFSYALPQRLLFSLSLSQRAGLQRWALIIADAKGRVCRELAGTGDIPAAVEWDGLDAEGKRLDDGRYTYQLSMEFASGNMPKSFAKELIVDSTAPSLSVDHSPGVFSPDGDGENDELNIIPSVRDSSDIDRWALTVYNPTGFVFKRFSGRGSVPGVIVWNGVSDSGELVESAEDYTVEFAARDIAGNESSIKGHRIPVDILVVVTERGLKIKISNIEFAFGSARMLGRAGSILDRVGTILGKYAAYSVIIEGHTDDVGDEGYNLKLSEQRAAAVFDYLLKRGIERERLQFRGMGETAPYLPNTDNENRRKNRRVEFLLQKKGG